MSTLGVAMLVGLVWGTVSVGAVFAPVDRAALKAAVGTCLSETADGSCPDFAASYVPGTVNPYGVIGDWNMSAVTSMEHSRPPARLVVTAPTTFTSGNTHRFTTSCSIMSHGTSSPLPSFADAQILFIKFSFTFSWPTFFIPFRTICTTSARARQATRSARTNEGGQC